jgi:hypothetical protein
VVALVVSFLGLAIGIGIVLWFMRRRPVGAPVTWGEAMVGATFVFFLLFLAYGVIPHQWLNYADSELQWRKDAIGVPLGPIDANVDFGPIVIEDHTLWPEGVPLPNGNFVITKEAVRDVVATLIYVVFLGIQIAMWAIWQARGKEKPVELPTSPYGRPILRKT